MTKVFLKPPLLKLQESTNKHKIYYFYNGFFFNNIMKGDKKMIENITAKFTQFVENIMAPEFNFYDIIAAIITAIGLKIIF